MAFNSTGDHIAGTSVYSYGEAGASGDTVTLIGAGVAKCQAIYTISVNVTGTVTAFNIAVFKNDGSTVLCRIGGQVGGAATGPMGPMVWNFDHPIICARGDNAKVVVTATGGAALTVGVGYELVTD